MSHLAATGITIYLENDGRLEHARQMAGHESPRTAKLQHRTKDENYTLASGAHLAAAFESYAALARPRDARLTARSRLALHAQYATDAQTSNEAAVRQLPWPILPSPSPTARNRLLNVREEP